VVTLDSKPELEEIVKVIKENAKRRLENLDGPVSNEEYKRAIEALAVEIFADTGRKCNMRVDADSVYEFEFRETLDDTVVKGYSYTDRHPISCEVEAGRHTLVLEIEGVEVTVAKELKARFIRTVEDWRVGERR
jgi:hypothetical protein